MKPATCHSFSGWIACMVTIAAAISGCGKAPATSGNVTVQSHPLAGPSAASLFRGQLNLAQTADVVSEGLFSLFTASSTANAAVSTFVRFAACNDTMIVRDQNGNPLSIGGSTSPTIGQGLLVFSPTSGSSMLIGSTTIPAGTQVSEIDITFANVPSVCGVNYAVEFNPGTGNIDITQNTAFKFTFPSPKTITDGSTIDLMFGNIVNAMVAQGAGLNNATIQNVAVGLAQ